MVFPVNGSEAKLINFNLMDEVDQPYPPCYNDKNKLPDCHSEAKPDERS